MMALVVVAGGCFLRRTSRTVSGVVLDPERLSKWSGPPPLFSAISLSAALTLPSIISFAKIRAVCWADFSRVE